MMQVETMLIMLPLGGGGGRETDGPRPWDSFFPHGGQGGPQRQRPRACCGGEGRERRGSKWEAVAGRGDGRSRNCKPDGCHFMRQEAAKRPACHLGRLPFPPSPFRPPSHTPSFIDRVTEKATSAAVAQRDASRLHTNPGPVPPLPLPQAQHTPHGSFATPPPQRPPLERKNASAPLIPPSPLSPRLTTPVSVPRHCPQAAPPASGAVSQGAERLIKAYFHAACMAWKGAAAAGEAGRGLRSGDVVLGCSAGGGSAGSECSASTMCLRIGHSPPRTIP